jgi:hypothetical protein
VYVSIPDEFISALQRDTPHEKDVTELQSEFPEVITALEQAINELTKEDTHTEGFCPKLNGVLPRDASWVLGESVPCCHSSADVLLLLRMSARIGSIKPTWRRLASVLALQRWERIHTAYEFRSFVSNGRVIAVCQRHPDTAYSFLAAERDQIVTALARFYEQRVRPLHPQLAECIVDGYLDEHNQVHVLSIDPWSDEALLLFETAEMALLREQVATALQSGAGSPTDERIRCSKGNDWMERICFRSVGEGFAPMSSLWREMLPLELRDEYLRHTRDPGMFTNEATTTNR